MIVGQFRRLYNGPVGMGTLGGVYDIGINKDALTGREISAHSPRIMPQRFADVNARPGYVRLRGQESRTSLNKVSILARKLTSVHARITTKMEFVPPGPPAQRETDSLLRQHELH